jgi:two-component system, NarL family, sensor histidine kinase DevS
MHRVRDRKDMLLEAGLTLASELSLPIVLQRLVDLAAQVTDARYGALGVIGDGDELVEFVTTGLSNQQRKLIGDPPRGRGVLGLLIHDPRPVRIKDITKHRKSVGFPPNHPQMHSFLGAPVQAMGRVFGNIYLAEKRSAAEFSQEDEEAVVILATQAGVAIANASLYEEIRSRERWLDALRDITTEILGGADADALLARIAEDACEVANAQAAMIVAAAATPGELEVEAAAGANLAGVAGRTFPAAESISDEVMRTGEPLVFNDASVERAGHHPIIQEGRVGPAIFVPLRVRGRATGTLMVANLKGGRVFDERTVRMVQTFADQASIAIEYGRAHVDQTRLSLMEDRERIAKELHDGIVQSLFAVGMSLQGTALIARSPDIAFRLDGAVNELDRVIRDLRNYIFGLRPGILADRQLDQALRVLGEEMQSRSTARVEVDVDAALAQRLSARSTDLVQLTREALSNVSRHAQATHATVRLARRGAKAVLTIEDDGVGFDTSHNSLGSGLRNMRERAAALGATLVITSRPGKGTRLQMTLPV